MDVNGKLRIAVKWVWFKYNGKKICTGSKVKRKIHECKEYKVNKA